MIIKKFKERLNRMIPLPNGGWLSFCGDHPNTSIIKISSSGEISTIGPGHVGVEMYENMSQVYAWQENNKLGVNDNGELIDPYVESETIKYKYSKKYEDEVITRSGNKVTATILGIGKGEVGIGFLNLNAKETKLLVIHEGVFEKCHQRLCITISHDETTAIIWQGYEGDSNFVIVDIDI